MALDRPALQELIDRIHDDINSRLPGADSRLRRSMLDVLGRVHAGVAHSLYGYVDYTARQIFPDTAEGKYLNRWAAIWGLDRKPAVKAQGFVVMTGTELTVCPLNTRLQAADGTEYRVTADTAIDDPVPIKASVGGVAGDLLASVQLQFVSPVAGIDTLAVVDTGGITGGADEESDDQLRARLLGRIRQPPQGGALADYKQWALEVPEVTRAFIIPGHAGAGSVGVTFMMDGRTNPIPTADDVAAVDAYIEYRRPVTASVGTFAPTPIAVDVDISVTPAGNPAVEAAITAELEDFFRRDPQLGVDVRLSRLSEAISQAKGEVFHVINTPSADVSITGDQIAVLGTVTFS